MLALIVVPRAGRARLQDGAHAPQPVARGK